jgi:hypothetical protein
MQSGQTISFSGHDADMVFILFPMRKNQSHDIIASAEAALMTSTSKGHPRTGIIFLNPEYIPKKSQNFNSPINDYFLVLYHEGMHLLGMTRSLFEWWVDPITGRPYGNKFPIKNFTIGNRTWHIISTPSLFAWSCQRFGSELIFSLSPGLILDDDYHPSTDLYLGDVMTSRVYCLSQITELSLIVLNDTGWYTIDFSRVPLLHFRYGPSFGQPAQRKWLHTVPQIYCGGRKSEDSCTWDFRAYGPSRPRRDHPSLLGHAHPWYRNKCFERPTSCGELQVCSRNFSNNRFCLKYDNLTGGSTRSQCGCFDLELRTIHGREFVTVIFEGHRHHCKKVNERLNITVRRTVEGFEVCESYRLICPSKAMIATMKAQGMILIEGDEGDEGDEGGEARDTL